MGLLDKAFRKREDRKKENIENPIKEKTNQKNETNMGANIDGSHFFEYYDPNIKPGQTYNITRVVVKNSPKVIEGDTVYECIVSWFMENVTQKRNGQDVSVDTVAYNEVVAGIDVDKMEQDEEYLKLVMISLFEKNQVENYMSNALKSEEELASILRRNPGCGVYPCGKYIGTVEMQDRKAKKNI